MTVNPTDSIAEILGQPATLGMDPARQSYLCPYVDRRCTKRSTAKSGEPYPVCVIKKRDGAPVCVCPKRFHEVDFLQDVIDHAWPGEQPANPQIAREVKMAGFGNVDFVIADTGDDNTIRKFLSVELQAIDITGTVCDAYDAIIDGRHLDKKKSYSLNWKNVYKRYVNQLISKGYYHHHWGSKIVAVVQDEIYEYLCNDVPFPVNADVRSDGVNIIFMSYRFRDNGNRGYIPELAKVEGTHHTNLQHAILYKPAPSRAEFEKKISSALTR